MASKKKTPAPVDPKTESVIVVFNNDCSANVILYEDIPEVLINAVIHNRRYTGVIRLKEVNDD